MADDRTGVILPVDREELRSVHRRLAAARPDEGADQTLRTRRLAQGRTWDGPRSRHRTRRLHPRRRRHPAL